MAAENRLRAEQLTALAAGDAVTIECAGNSRRPRHVAGTVVRVTGSHIVVSVRSSKGVTYQERYGRRDGIRHGSSLIRAELVDPRTTTSASPRRRQTIDVLYHEWTRDRSDVERLRRLQAAISEALEADRAAEAGSSRVVTPAESLR